MEGSLRTCIHHVLSVPASPGLGRTGRGGRDARRRQETPQHGARWRISGVRSSQSETRCRGPPRRDRPRRWVGCDPSSSRSNFGRRPSAHQSPTIHQSIHTRCSRPQALRNYTCIPAADQPPRNHPQQPNLPQLPAPGEDHARDDFRLKDGTRHDGLILLVWLASGWADGMGWAALCGYVGDMSPTLYFCPSMRTYLLDPFMISGYLPTYRPSEVAAQPLGICRHASTSILARMDLAQHGPPPAIRPPVSPW